MTDRVLRLTAQQRESLLQDSRIGLPAEICGILGGVNGQVAEIFPVSNMSSQPENSFFMDPMGLFHVLTALEARGLAILAMYHSHPPGARTDPSSSDRRMASYPGSLQVIVVPGLPSRPDSIRAFDVIQAQVVEIPIVIV